MLLAADALPLVRPGLQVVAVAASAGGIATTGTVLAALPADFPAAVLVVQHRYPTRPTFLDRILARHTPLPVREPEDGEGLRGGHVYVCAPDRRTWVRPDGTFCVVESSRRRRPRPAADPIFHSVAGYAGERAVGVVLTGFGSDGAAGAAEINRRGGVVLVQEPATCEAACMPEAVLDGCGADFVLPPEKIGDALVSLTMAPSVSAALFGVAGRRWRYRIRAA